MTAFPFYIVGFDLDGTLVDTVPDLAAAANHALASVGRDALSVPQVRGIVGGGTRHMLGLALAQTGGCDEATLDAALPTLLAHYEAHIADASMLYPGVTQALDALRDRDVRLAVVTNKLGGLSHTLLTTLGIADRFALILGGDQVQPNKPDRAPIDAMVARLGGGRAAFVGDTIYDITAARAAGVTSVAVSFGYRDRPAAELGADRVIDRYADLLSTLEQL